MLRKLLVGSIVLLVLAFAAMHAGAAFLLSPLDLPEYEPVEEVVWLDEQGWTADDRQWYYHASQGGAMDLPIPYEWIVALERPEVPLLIVTDAGPLLEPEYIARFGMLSNDVTAYDPAGLSLDWAAVDGFTKLEDYPANNPDQLPVGFAKTVGWEDQRTGNRLDVMGFSCSACHTGQLDYQGTGIRIEGGASLVDWGRFRTAVGLSLALTYAIPTRFGRFADRVLGQDATDDARDRLRAHLRRLLDEGRALQAVEQAHFPTEEGYTRIDALARIHNYVMGYQLDPANYAVGDGPVTYPHLWDTPWMDWVQYNNSVSQPMGRNVGEAMGVFVSVNLHDLDDDERLFRSTVDVVGLYEMESLIRGPEPFHGLRSPEWPEEILGPLDGARVARGEALYRETCQRCHLPPTSDPEAFLADSLWTEPQPDNAARYLHTRLIDLWEVGTDPRTAVNFYQRVARLGPLADKLRDGLTADGGRVAGVAPAGAALAVLVEKVQEKRYDDLGVPDSIRPRFNGLKPPGTRAPLGYRARPLNGVWATPPFLHNGSVPNLFQLLGPVEERDDEFWLGTREFDPVRVGYVNEPVENGFLLDTSLRGNSNAGHRLCGSADPASPDYWRLGCPPVGDPEGARSTMGVVGPALGVEERWALIEFLKSLPNSPRPR